MIPVMFAGGIAAFLLGAVLGSFLNMLVFRVRAATTILGRSRCPHCDTVLSPRHLVPIVSWFLLRGRCAFCGKAIHIQYPLVEAAAGVLTAIAHLRHPALLAPGETSFFLFETAFALILLFLLVFDWRWRVLPIEIMLVASVLFGAWRLFLDQPITGALLGASAGFGFLGLQVLFSRGRWLGSGDPWLGLMIGAALGWPGIGFSLYATYLLGGLIAVILLVSQRVRRKSRIPFAPLLALGAYVALWFGTFFQHLVARFL